MTCMTGTGMAGEMGDLLVQARTFPEALGLLVYYSQGGGGMLRRYRGSPVKKHPSNSRQMDKLKPFSWSFEFAWIFFLPGKAFESPPVV